MGSVKSLWVIPELCKESFTRMNRDGGLVGRRRVLVINGNGLHHIAIIIRERTSVANCTPHCHVKRVVGGRFFSVVQPKYKIMFAHILPEEKVLLIT